MKILMKTRRRLLSLLVLTLICSVGVSAFAGNGPATHRKGPGYVALTEAEVATLKFMREEEKLARDVYLVMYEQYKSVVFANIAKSEQKHMDAIKRMLDKYGVPDPASTEFGVFNDASLQQLYDKLVVQGQVSELDAFKVGALIEEVDIEDLLAAIEETSKIPLDRVYGNLLRGSEKHLRAFVAHIEMLGEDYVAQHLPQDVVDDILE